MHRVILLQEHGKHLRLQRQENLRDLHIVVQKRKQNFILILITTELRFHFQPENMIIMQWYQQESKTMHFHQLKFLTDIELHYIMMQDSKEEQKFFFRIHQI